MKSMFNNICKITLGSNLSRTQVRFYPRWSHRRPINVYSPEEYEALDKKEDTSSFSSTVPESNSRSKSSTTIIKTQSKNSSETVKYSVGRRRDLKPLVASQQNKKPERITDMLETIIDGEGNFVYTKMKDNDHRVGRILSEIKSKKAKEKKDLIMLEGKRLIKDALQSGCRLKYILFSRKGEIEYLKPYLPKVGASLFKMPYREMQLWSDLTTNPGIMGIFNTPDVGTIQSKSSIPLTVICDNIREPGNLGSILRICAGSGCANVILTKGCVNLWDSKVLRSSVGAHFKIPIALNMEWNEIEKVTENASFFIADNKVITGSDESLAEIVGNVPVLPYYSVDFKSHNHTIIVVGGETLGVSTNSYDLALRTGGARLNIPLTNDVDSLNVGAALGIITFEIRKQLLVTST